MQNNQINTSVSLITTCKGRLRYLKKALPSWLKLDYDNYDIIIVDYDDPDGTEEYINNNKEDLLKNSKAKNIKVVKVKNKPYFNLNDARNRGIDASDSELIFMIDSDIIINDENLLKKVENDYKRDKIFWSNLMILNSNYKEAILYNKLQFEISVEYPMILPFPALNPGQTGTSCFLKKIYSECGKFKPEINKHGYGFDDREFYVRYLNYYF